MRARTVVPWSQRIGVSWHWIGPGKGPSEAGLHSACLKQVRDWQAQHQANGWKDIGYNALVCKHARAIEGRGLEFSGSHSPGVNYEHVGIQLMVGDASAFPSDAMIARAVRLRADIGHLGKNIRRDWAHRDDKQASTECPGDAIANWVHTGGPTKTATATPSTKPTPAPAQEADVAFKDESIPRPSPQGPVSATEAISGIMMNAYRTKRDTSAILVELAGLESTIGGMLDLLKSQADGVDLPSKDEILAQVRASADAKMATLDFGGAA